METNPENAGDAVQIAHLIISEFAKISVMVDLDANGPRLRLEDLRTGKVRFLDALELETIIWLPEESLTALLDPSASRWRGDA